MELSFVKASSEKSIKDIFEYNIDAFTDSPDFEWTIGEIKREVDKGWELYAVQSENEIIAALFLKSVVEELQTKNTAIKMNYQGSGYSHQIKYFFKQTAKERGLKRILHYCRIDDFRMYSLNEGHGYIKSDNKLGEGGHIVEWIKEL